MEEMMIMMNMMEVVIIGMEQMVVIIGWDAGGELSNTDNAYGSDFLSCVGAVIYYK